MPFTIPRPNRCRPPSPTSTLLARVRACLDSPSPWSRSPEVAELAASRRRNWPRGWRDETKDDPLGIVRCPRRSTHRQRHRFRNVDWFSSILKTPASGRPAGTFAPLALGVERYGVPAEDFEQFVAGYGSEPGAWPGFSLMCRVYELVATSWAIRCSGDSARMAGEAAVRISGLLDGDPSPWAQL